jgi:hypothetical protein
MPSKLWKVTISLRLRNSTKNYFLKMKNMKNSIVTSSLNLPDKHNKLLGSLYAKREEEVKVWQRRQETLENLS